MIKYTEEQRRLIELNKNVAKCGQRNITYLNEFKLQAVQAYEQGESPQTIFRKAGFNLSLIGRETAKQKLKDWNRINRLKGPDKLLTETRGKATLGKSGRPKTKGLTEKERIKYLEAQVEYLKAENVFLAKLRAKKKAE
jgi:transposase